MPSSAVAEYFRTRIAFVHGFTPPGRIQLQGNVRLFDDVRFPHDRRQLAVHMAARLDVEMPQYGKDTLGRRAR